MKKLYIFFIAMISVSGLFAQDRSRNNYEKDNEQNRNKDWNYTHQNDTYKDNAYSNDDRYYNRQPQIQEQDRRYSNDGRYYNKQQPQIQEQDRRAAIDRVNRDCDQQINRYRNDRSLNPYERERRIAQIQQERTQKINSFGKGVITGAIVGLIAGVLFSK